MLSTKQLLPNTAEASYYDNTQGPVGLGSLSAKYESNGNPGTIANTKGDLGGKSYGTYQLTANSVHAQKFANKYGGALKGLKVGSSAFDTAWKNEAEKNPDKFKQAQHQYIAQAHFQPALNAFKSTTGIKNTEKMPIAVQNMIWSIGVQHGAGGARNVFKNSGVKSSDSWETMIKKVYAERSKVNTYFKSSPQNIKNSVYNRFQKEMNDALKQLKG